MQKWGQAREGGRERMSPHKQQEQMRYTEKYWNFKRPPGFSHMEDFCVWKIPIASRDFLIMLCSGGLSPITTNSISERILDCFRKSEEVPLRGWKSVPSMKMSGESKLLPSTIFKTDRKEKLCRGTAEAKISYGDHTLFPPFCTGFSLDVFVLAEQPHIYFLLIYWSMDIPRCHFILMLAHAGDLREETKLPAYIPLR